MILGKDNTEIERLKGNFTGGNFTLTDKNEQIAMTVDEKLENAGDILKEIITSANNYLVKIGNNTMTDKIIIFMSNHHRHTPSQKKIPLITYTSP